MRKQVCTAMLSIIALPWLGGCQTPVHDQQLPSPSYMTDEISYYAPSEEASPVVEAQENRNDNLEE